MNLSSFKMLKNLCLTGSLTIALCGLHVTTGSSSTSSIRELAFGRTEYQTRVHALNPPELPVRITGTLVPTDEDHVNLALRYTVTNLTARSVSKLEVAVYMLGRNGRIKSGEVWRIPVELAARATDSFSMSLTNKWRTGYGVTVAVQEVVQDQTTWRFDAISFLQSARISVIADGSANVSRLDSAKNSVATNAYGRARFVAYRDPGCGSDFCARQTTAASASCGCGVSSFSCDQTNCTVSWTCNHCLD